MRIIMLITFVNDGWNYEEVLYYLASNFNLEFKNCHYYVNGNRCIKLILKSISENEDIKKYLADYATKNKMKYRSLFGTRVDFC